MPESDELVIAVAPEKLWAVAGAAAFFAIPVFGLLWIAADDGLPSELWLTLCMGAMWLALTAAWVLLVVWFVRELRSPGIRLHSNGFDYRKHTWLWTDIAAIDATTRGTGESRHTVLLVTFKSRGSAPSEVVDMPFDPRDFKTGGTLLEVILRQWLTRYGDQSAGTR